MRNNEYKTTTKNEVKYNFNIIKLKSSHYVPLDKLGTIDKILMAFRWYLDKSYRDEALKNKKMRQEQTRNERIFFLRRYLLDALKDIPLSATDILIQIDNSYLDILDDVISYGFNDYVIEPVKMNKNYFKFIRAPHPILKFNFRDTIFKNLVIGGDT